MSGTSTEHWVRMRRRLWAALALAALATGALIRIALDARFERDVTRMVFNDNLELLDEVRLRSHAEQDSLDALIPGASARPESAGAIVISIADNHLWYRVGDSVVFEAPVATGSGKVLVRGASGARWRFETPRGRLRIIDKDTDPMWVPPDWHYVEVAANRRLELTRLQRGQRIPLRDGSEIAVQGSDVVKRQPDGRVEPIQASDGREIVVDGRVIVPPFGTNQRRYPEVMGTHRLVLGDGYAIHGTNNPSSIGRSVSHGCVRLRNEDIATLYSLVPVGTPVFIY